MPLLSMTNPPTLRRCVVHGMPSFATPSCRHSYRLCLKDALDSRWRHQRNSRSSCRRSQETSGFETTGKPFAGKVCWRVCSKSRVESSASSSVGGRSASAAGLGGGRPRRIEELFGTISSWAEASGARLVVGESTALNAEPMRWITEDLGSVFAWLSPRAFQSRDPHGFSSISSARRCSARPSTRRLVRIWFQRFARR